MGRVKKNARRSKGCGCLFKDARTQVWQMRIRANGRVYTRSSKTRDKAEAEKVLAEFASSFVLGNEKSSLENIHARMMGVDFKMKKLEEEREEAKRHLPLKDVLDFFFAHNGKYGSETIGTHVLYGDTMRSLVRWATTNGKGIEFAHQLTKSDANAYVVDATTKVGNSVLHLRISRFQYIWKILLKEGMVKENIWSEVGKPKMDKSLKRPLTDEEVARIYEVVKDDEEMTRFFKILEMSGVRFGDACMMNWKSIDLVSGFITFVPMKTKRVGTKAVIPICDALREELEKTPIGERNGFVLPTISRKYLDRNLQRTFRSKVAAIFDKAGIVRYIVDEEGKKRFIAGCHSLRHRFISMLANSGTPLSVVMSISAHRSTNMVAHYYHEDEKVLKESVARAFNTRSAKLVLEKTIGTLNEIQAIDILRYCVAKGYIGKDAMVMDAISSHEVEAIEVEDTPRLAS